jgi:hypothetical protein
MLKALGVAAVIALAGTTAAPAQAAVAPVTLAPVAVASTVAVEAAPDAVVTFESPEVGTVAAPEEVAPVVAEPVVTEPVTEPTPGPTPEPVTILPTPVAPVENISTPTVGGTVTEEATPEVVEEPVTVPETPAEPPVIEEPVVTPEDTTAIEMFEGTSEDFKPEGGKYIGTYKGPKDIWTGEGKVAVKGTMTTTVDGNPNNMAESNILYFWHVYTI